MTFDVHRWWEILSVVAVMNLIAWCMSVVVLAKRHESFFSSPHHRQRRWMMWLSAAYVAGCAFRSFLPRIDLERICLLQSPLSNMLLGRSVATVAELCFIAQCALLLHQAGAGVGNNAVKTVSWLLLPMIVVAECASWYAILSTNYFGHFVENSIWTVCAAMLLGCLFVLRGHSTQAQRHFLSAMLVFAAGYILFMLNIDLPMYWSRWTLDQVAGVSYLSLYKGVQDAYQACVVDFSWAVWHQEMPWMTLYFTAAVWVSIYLPHVPGWMNGTSPTHTLQK